MDTSTASSADSTKKRAAKLFSENYNRNKKIVALFIEQSLRALVHKPMVIKEQDRDDIITISIPDKNSVKKVAQIAGRFRFIVIGDSHIVVQIMLKGTPEQIHKDEIYNLSFITVSNAGKGTFSSDKVEPNQWHFTKNQSTDGGFIFHYLTIKFKLTTSLIDDFSEALTALLECKIFNNIDDSIFNYWLNKQAISSLNMDKPLPPPVKKQPNTPTPSTSYKSATEHEVRTGQGPFRMALMDESGRECMLSGPVPEQSLIASHVVPWKPNDKFKDNSGMPLLSETELDQYRLDKNNGLLLNAVYDSLFDKFLMTVKQDGTLAFNGSVVSEEHKENLGLSHVQKIQSKYMTVERKKYLKYHNKFFVWKKNQSE